MNCKFLFFSFIILLLDSLYCNEGENQYPLSVNLSYQLCDPEIQSADIQGSQVFLNTGPSQDINSFGVSGWFLLRGYLPIDHNLVTVKEGSQILYQVTYNVVTSQFQANLLSNPTKPLIASSILIVLKNSWYFLISKVRHDITNSKILLDIIIHDSQGSFLATDEYISPPQNFFRKKDLSFNIGNPSAQVPQSCSFTKSVYIYWDSQLIGYQQLINDISSFNTLMIQNYDLTYSEQNPGYQIGIIEPMPLLSLSFNRQEKFVLRNDETLLIEYINSSEQQGFVITFHIKLNPIPVTPIKILTFNEINSLIYLQVSSSQLHINTQPIVGVFPNQWYQITLVVKMQLQTVQVIVNDNLSNPSTLTYTDRFVFTQIQFGFSSNVNVNIYLNYIRVYQGTFLSDSVDCLLKAARSQKSCIICRNPNLINYQNFNTTCVPLSSINKSTIIDNVKDWFPIKFKCQRDMILDSLTNNCICRYQFYRIGDECFQCPNYCRGCYNESTCIKMDPNRLMNGKCKPGYFDDGYSCILPILTIKSKINLIKSFSTSDFLAGCTFHIPPLNDHIITQDDLQIQPNSSFFFGISLFAYGQETKAMIGYLADGGIEIISIFFEFVSMTNLSYITFYVKGLYQKRFLINKEENIWIGVWTDLQNAFFFVKTNGQLLSSQEINISYGQLQNSPEICIGKCQLQPGIKYLCAKYGQFQYIYNISQPQDISLVEQLIPSYSYTLSDFTVDFFNLPSDFLQDLARNKFLIFPPLTGMNRFKGIKFTQNEFGKIKNLELYSQIPIFSCFIFIEKLTYQTQLFSAELGLTNLEYYLVPYGTRAFVRICLFEVCYDSKYSMLEMNQHNTLTIISRNLGEYAQDDFFYQQFEVICNYQREFFKHIQTDSSSIISPQYIFIAHKSPYQSGEHIIYLNNISIDQGNGSYYIDETLEEPCFLFRNIYHMKCMIPKKDYYFFENTFITEQECHQLTDITSSLHVINKSTRQCIDAKITSLCLEINEISLGIECKKCRYQNADIYNHCNCPPKTFLNKTSRSCEPCSYRCQDCIGNSNNCITCKQLDQQPPSCNCILSNYYLDSQHICQECSQKCSTCDQSKEQCITCSYNRVQPPFCGCDTSSQEVNQECKQLQCDNKCQTCTKSASNCLVCKQGRINPPECYCDVNFYANPQDGTCVKCPSGSYYDSYNNICKICQKPCKECAGQNDVCLNCDDGLILQGQSCYCENENSAIFSPPDKYSCLEDMDVSVKIKLVKTFYQFEFYFDYDLQQISSYDAKRIQSLIQISFSEVSQDNYFISFIQVRDNILFIKLNIIKSFQTISGKILFIDNTRFLSVSQRYVLSSIYQKQPISFEIGPFFFEEDILDQGYTDAIIDYLKNQNPQLQKTFSQFQFILYFLNTAQPTLLFMQLKAQLPPNLYKFYQMIGLLIYPDVVDYQSMNYKNKFDLFQMKLNQTEIYQSNHIIYKKLGLSNSFLVNVQGVALKYLILIIIIVFTQILLTFYYNYSLKSTLLIEKIKDIQKIILKKLNSENDTNLLLVTMCILQQLTYDESTNWAVRFGYYCSIIFTLIISLSALYNYFEINTTHQYNKDQYSYQFTERLQNVNNSFLSRNYFLIQLLKKYLLILVLFIFKELPKISCFINGLIILMSTIQTIIAKPYQNWISRSIKICGEIIISVTWILHVVIIKIEEEIYKSTLVNNSLIEKYMKVGHIITILLIIFNTLYIIEIIQQVYTLVKDYLNSKKQQPQNIQFPNANNNYNMQYHKQSHSNTNSLTKKSTDYQVVDCQIPHITIQRKQLKNPQQQKIRKKIIVN